MVGSILVVGCVLSVVAASETQGGDCSAFRKATAPSLKRLSLATFADIRCGKTPKNQRNGEADIKQQLIEAEHEFREQVAAYWPYDDPESKKQQQASAEALKEIHSVFSRAKGGEMPNIGRDEAVRRIFQLAEVSPNSPVSDEAYFLAAYLFWDIQPRQPEEGFKLMRQVNASTGPFNAFQIGAMDNLASESNDDGQRLQDRQRFSATLRELHDPSVLEERLLNPLPMESQDRYVNRVLGALTNIEGSYLLNASNMTVDAMRTEQPQSSRSVK